MNKELKSFNDLKIDHSELSNINGGKRVYVGGTYDCETGTTTITWANYNIFGNYTGNGKKED